MQQATRRREARVIATRDLSAHVREILLSVEGGASPWTPVTRNANLSMVNTGLIRGASIQTSGTPAGGCWGGGISCCSPRRRSAIIRASRNG